MDKTEKLTILDDLIKLETVNDFEKRTADYLKALFDKHGIACELTTYAPNRCNLVATVHKGDGPILGFTGHQDVVDPVDANKWAFGPYQPTHHEGKILGRGASDMKSGLAGLAIAMIELNADPDFTGNLRFLATVGEELGEVGAIALAQAGYADDLAGLIVGEPSNASSSLVMQKMVGGGMILMPKDAPKTYGRHSFFRAHKGSLTYQIVSRGKAAHSSMPEAGVNALDNLITYYNAQKAYFETLTTYHDDVLGTTNPAVTIFNAGKQANTIPDHAEMTVKIRTIPEYPNDRLAEEIQALVAKVNADHPGMALEYVEDSDNWPVKTQDGAKLLDTVHESYAAIWHEPAMAVGAPGGTDASQFVKANPNLEVVVAGPGNESAHQINEFVLEEDYLKYIDLYQDIAKRYFA